MGPISSMPVFGLGPECLQRLAQVLTSRASSQVCASTISLLKFSPRVLVPHTGHFSRGVKEEPRGERSRGNSHLTNTRHLCLGAIIKSEGNYKWRAAPLHQLSLQKWKLSLSECQPRCSRDKSLFLSERKLKLTSSGLSQQHSRVSAKHWWVQLITFTLSTTRINTKLQLYSQRMFHSFNYLWNW